MLAICLNCLKNIKHYTDRFYFKRKGKACQKSPFLFSIFLRRLRNAKSRINTAFFLVKNKASMTIFDTSGIEAWVTENNSKYANRIIKQLKAFKKSHNLDDSYDPYKAAYGSMPTHAASNQAIQQMYINGHFCYAYKFGIITNGLGIVRNITFYNKDFLQAHPDIVVEKKSDSPDEDKSLADSKALLPVLIDFFQKHPLIEPKTFLGDAAFDAIKIYKTLFEEIGFQKAFIPLKTKLTIEGIDYTVNENGIPCCPHDPSKVKKLSYSI